LRRAEKERVYEIRLLRRLRSRFRNGELNSQKEYMCIYAQLARVGERTGMSDAIQLG